jgi:hypothetical protein
MLLTYDLFAEKLLGQIQLALEAHHTTAFAHC